MSRLGKRPIAIPNNTQVSVVDGLITVKGPKGELSLHYKPAVKVTMVEGFEELAVIMFKPDTLPESAVKTF